MKMFGVLFLGVCLAAATAPVHAAPQDRRSDQEAARKGRMQGHLLPLRAIEARVVPLMAKKGAQYIGFDFDSGTGIYTLKFLRNGNVIWIDVDGRTGQIVGQSGG
jgi:hypothetical protein